MAKRKAKKSAAGGTARKSARGRQASPAYPVVCPGRAVAIDAEAVGAAQAPGEQYRALPEIIDAIVASCRALPEIHHLDASTLPDPDAVVRIIEVAREIFFPGYYGDRNCTPENLAYHIGDRLHQLYLMLSEQIYRSVRHECRRPGPECPHCKTLAEIDAPVSYTHLTLPTN